VTACTSNDKRTPHTPLSAPEQTRKARPLGPSPVTPLVLSQAWPSTAQSPPLMLPSTLATHIDQSQEALAAAVESSWNGCLHNVMIHSRYCIDLTHHSSQELALSMRAQGSVDHGARPAGWITALSDKGLNLWGMAES
jgi:hypothetical protein